MTNEEFLCEVASKCAPHGVPPGALDVVSLENGTAIRVSLPDGTFNSLCFRTTEKPLQDFVRGAVFRVSKEWRLKSEMCVIDGLSPEARALVSEYGAAAALAAIRTFETTALAAEFLAQRRAQAQEFKLCS